MRNRIFGLALALWLAGVPGPAGADEGMWMLHQIGRLDQAQLRRMGLHLTPDQIWNARTRTGLAAAVVSLGNCSASFVSPEGLIATNHHCAFDAVQLASTPEQDYIASGFLARSRSAEVEARGTRVWVFQGYDDVTQGMLSALTPGMKPEERTQALQDKERQLVAACEQPGLRCRLASMYGGLEYYLFRTLELRDVRLVYVPPRAIGEYGGEVDNWMWPRHTGDFSFLRAYVGRDGQPADYSPDNVPYKPERWLRLARGPVKDGDFAMILGYPGRTMRLRIAAEIAQETDANYPERIAAGQDVIAILEQQSQRGKDVALKLAARLKALANTYKKNRGMLEGLRHSGLAQRKRAVEAELTRWIEADASRRQRFGDVLPRMEALLAARAATRLHDQTLDRIVTTRGSLLRAALDIEKWSAERAKPDLQRELGFQDRDERTLRVSLARLRRTLDLEADRAVLRYGLERAGALPEGQRIASIDAALAATGRSGPEALEALLDTLYGATRLADPEARLALFAMPHATLRAQGDALIEFAAALRVDLDAVEARERRDEGESVTLVPRLCQALMEWSRAPLSADANSTLRFTYGAIKGFVPRDGVLYQPFTTLSGVVEKHTGVEPFNAPQRLLEAARLGRRGRWVDPVLGDVPVAFLSTNDITGGNSGSPTMNGDGELIGLAFDGDYESMTSDFQFSTALSRTINVDVRYVLWVMEFVDGAHDLLRELGFEPREAVSPTAR